jgi:predicted transcriptional regulator
MNENIDDDELDEMIMRAPTMREKKVSHHDMMFKALSNPIRRKVIVLIGAFGKSRSEIEEELNIDKSLFKYHIDFLKEGKYIFLEGDIFRLTDEGLTLLSNI